MKGNPVRTLCLKSLAVHTLVAGVVAGACTLPALRSLPILREQVQFATQPQTAPHIPDSIAMPQGSFLRKPASNVSALVKQVKSDPMVAVRYSRLFHLPVKMVPLALGQLHLTTLKSDHIMQVHFVRAAEALSENSATRQNKTQSKEELVYKPRRVRAGTPIYCLPDGTPLLIRICGNPIRTRVAPEFYSSVPVPDFNAGEKLLPVATNNTANLSMETRSVTLPITPLPVFSVVAAENVLAITALPLAPAMPPAALRTASLPPVYQWAHNYNGLFGGLAGAPLFGLLSAFNSGRGGTSAIPASPGSGTVPLPVTSVPTTPSTPGLPLIPIKGGSGGFTPGAVPEPGVMMISLVSIFGAGWLVYKRRTHR